MLDSEINNEENYKENEYPILKNNHRANKLLYHLLDTCEMRKVGTNKSAKSIWDALERLYLGNQEEKISTINACLMTF